MKRAFTLMEINLAILIMAGGILSVVGLYSFGFRENRQSAEDVQATAYADAVISPLVMAITATNLVWSDFQKIQSRPSDKGWGAYIDQNTGEVLSNPDNSASQAFGNFLSDLRSAANGTLDVDSSYPKTASGNLHAGLVIMHEKGSPVVRISFRAAKNPGMLLSAPLFYTEARFQGLPFKPKQESAP